MTLIKHKKSSTASAKPALNDLTLGELAINTRDGKAFTKKSDGTTEALVEFRGAIDQLRPTGQTGEELPSETAIRNAVSTFGITAVGDTPGRYTVSIPGITSYFDGLRITVKLVVTYDGTYNTININGIGQALLWYRPGSRLTSHLGGNVIATFTYDSTAGSYSTFTGGFVLDACYQDGGETYALRHNYVSPMTSVNGMPGYKLYGLTEDNIAEPFTITAGTGTNKTVNTSIYCLSKGIFAYHRSTNIAGNNRVTAAYTYIQLSTSVLNYTHNGIASPVPYAPIYLVANSFNGDRFTLDNSSYTSFLTQTLPTSEDGKFYIYLGRLYDSANNYVLEIDHPVYYFKDGALRLYNTSYVEGFSEFIPIYYVTSFAEFISAYNTIRAQYAGGKIVCAGDIIMTSDLTVDLTGITIEGDGCNWRFYNDVYLNPASVRKLIITAGSPTFIGIRFWGSSGQSSIYMDQGTTRHCFDISPSDNNRSMYVTFDRCAFLDIVAGQTTGAVIRVTENMTANASVNFTFIGCRIASHCSGSGINYLGLKIYHSYTGASTTNINVSVIDQIPSTEGEISNSSTLYVLQGYTTATSFTFNSDETAWLNSNTSLTGLTRSNNILNAVLSYLDSANDFILVGKGSDRKNVCRVPASALQASINAKENNLLGREPGAGNGEPQNIQVGNGLEIRDGVLNCTVNPVVQIANDKAELTASRLITTSTAWLDIMSSFSKTIALPPGTYLITAQAHFTRATSTQTFVGMRLTVGGAVVVAAENDFYRHVTLNCSIILTVASNTTITMQVYASAANVVSVVASTMNAPAPQAGQTTLINAVKIG